ncbi:excitatory amino acid transporter 3-like [Amphiura filiformis]|uniref:excitatory amino acid transporter 3-like n=1 Tax=Amphiura filiformis TaxID=82378 RepID=UPI003B223537
MADYDDLQYQGISSDNSKRSTRILSGVKKFCKANLLVILLLTSLKLGIIIGFAVKFGSNRDFSKKDVEYISFPGTLFLNALKMVIVPLITTSLISGMASLDKNAYGKLGGKAVLYYMTTTFIAVILGIIVVTSIQPGRGADKDAIQREGSSQQVNTADAFLDLLRNMVPPNIVAACFESYKTRQVPDEIEPGMVTELMSNITGATVTMVMTTEDGITSLVNESVMTTKMPMMRYKSEGGFEDKTNVLGLVVFSCFFGAIIGRMGRQGEPLKIFFDTFMEAIMRLVSLIIWTSPVGIFFLIMGKILEMDDWQKTFQQIGLYSATVMTGLAIHAFIVLPLILFIFARKNPVRYLFGVAPALMTAFATASSSATLPITLQCLEENLNIDRRVTRFVLPIGATVNMDGTALYEAVAAIFIAQVNGLNMDAKDIVTISITATLASIGAAGVPQAGLVTMVIVLNAVGLPIDDITLIIVIDWFLDRCRTTINVWGDSIGAGIVYERSKDELQRLPDPFEDNDKFSIGYQTPNINNTHDDTTL